MEERQEERKRMKHKAKVEKQAAKAVSEVKVSRMSVRAQNRV